MKHLFFLPFLFCTLLGCQTNPARNGTPVIKVLRVDKVEFSEYSVGSFEPPSACEGFELSEADLSEFFQKARSLPNESVASYRKRQLSRCQINGTAILEDGNEVSFTIDRARNAGLTMKNVKAPSPLKDGLYHCAECTSDKFYPSEWQASSDRPIIKSITISNNGFFTGDEKAYPNACDDFILTKDDVHEFFKGALPISISKYQYILSTPGCAAGGDLVLEDGRKGSWSIGGVGDSLGVMGIDGFQLFFYGGNVNNPLFSDSCDPDCISAGDDNY